ncbi:MAG: DUF4350 domain-containing protein [bacterium]|nr:DUF4350 domain-containing protein [bacterium]
MRLQSVLGALLVLFCTACSFGFEEKEIEVGFQGLARSNPYLGAQRLAEELGYEASGTTVLSQRPPTDWAMLIRDGVMKGGEPQAAELLQWAGDGGDLWVDLGDTSVWDDGHDDSLDGPSQWAVYYLLEELQLDVVDNDGDAGCGVSIASNLELPWPEQSVVLGDPGRRASVYWGKPTFAAMLKLPWGRGHVSFFSSLHGFDNHNLPDDDWAEFFEELMAGAEFSEPVRGLMVVYGDGQGFFTLLWEHAWFFLIAMGVLLAAWLWRVSRRFGPILEDPAWDPEGVGIGGGREFTEHIVAAGQTYERRGQLDWLLKAARDRAGVDTNPNSDPAHSSQPDAFLLRMRFFQTFANGEATSDSGTPDTQENEK